MGEWDDLRWFIVLNGIADAWLWSFDADGWRLRHGNPARGTLGILPEPGNPVATLDDALWLADVVAFDHDAPVFVSPAYGGSVQEAVPKDTAAAPPAQPIHPFEGTLVSWYWDSLNMSFGAAAELRFNGSYVLRYEEGKADPSTDFSSRFQGREELVSMYAMAARQPDVLSEYLCLYRLLEAADHANGKTFAATALPSIATRDFGDLRIVGDDEDYDKAPNAFGVYQERAAEELRDLSANGVSDVPSYLYRIRNSLAHGKSDVIASRRGDRFEDTARALPIVKLLARMAVEP